MANQRDQSGPNLKQLWWDPDRRKLDRFPRWRRYAREGGLEPVAVRGGPSPVHGGIVGLIDRQRLCQCQDPDA